MHDTAHVAAIDTHAERDRRGDDVERLVGEGLLSGAPRLAVHSGVVVGGSHSPGAQHRRRLLGLLATDAVHDDRLSGMAIDDVGDLLEPVDSRQHSVDEVGAIKSADQNCRLFEAELVDDIGAHSLGRRRGIGMHAGVGKAFFELCELAVLGAEVVAPVADAVSLVDREGANLESGRELEKAAREQALGGDEEQTQATLRGLAFG